MSYDNHLCPRDVPEIEVDCPGYIRTEPCGHCGELELREDPPQCFGCGMEQEKETFTACRLYAVVGSEESCGDCGYPAPDWEEHYVGEDD